jgi:hypothetical protein
MSSGQGIAQNCGLYRLWPQSPLLRCRSDATLMIVRQDGILPGVPHTFATYPKQPSGLGIVKRQNLWYNEFSRSQRQEGDSPKD